MAFSFPRTVAEKDGFITVKHSLEISAPRYVLIVPHDSSRLAFPDEVKRFFPQNSDLLHQVLEIKRDKGVRELASYIIQTVPGGIAVMVEVARGILDLNRRAEKSLGTVISKEIPGNLKDALYKIHDSIIHSIDQIIAIVPLDSRILCLHSMQTNPLDDAKAEFDDESMRSYVATREATIGVGPEMKVDIITGPKGEENFADLEMKNVLAGFFDQSGIPWVENYPYATERDIHKTTDYMIARPRKVLAIDFPKQFLCKGEAKDKTLSMVKTSADPQKIQKIGNIFAEVLKRCS